LPKRLRYFLQRKPEAIVAALPLEHAILID
jgi:hypothetical protein